jgi:hypothetical protein
MRCTARVALVLALGALGAAQGASACGPGAATPGAYCPLPEKGEIPRCLEPAQKQYSKFFEAVDDPEAHPGDTDAHLAQVEDEVAKGAGSEHAYLALSSLAYGYYRLAQRAAASPGEDPAIVGRLERWNHLLAQAYAASPEDASYRRAVAQAAADIDRRVDVALTCVDARGEAVACDSTEHVLRGIDAASRRAGIRGALARILHRFGVGEAP